MSSIFSSENLSTLSAVNNNLNNSSSLNTINESPPLIISNENRKRKQMPAHFTRIKLKLLSKFFGSTESINSIFSSSGFGSDDESILTPSLSIVDDTTQPFVSFTNNESEKKRLKTKPKFLTQLSTTSSQSSASSSRTNSLVLFNDSFDFVELECFESININSPNFKLPFGGFVIGNGEFELINDGCQYKAINIATQTIYHCQILKSFEYKHFLNVIKRLKIAETMFESDEFNYFKSLIIPNETRCISGENGIWYIILPNYYDDLQSLIKTNYNNLNLKCKLLTERKIQSLFKQIVLLLNFCHQIGIYFRDFRLKKFIFIDCEKTQLRLNSVMDIWIAPEINNELMSQQHCCPAYVAPEILDIKTSKFYAGKSADIWAVGVLMFILLTGRYPFYEANPTALFKRIKARRFSFLINEYISPSARWLLHGILRLNPKERPTAAQILQSHWLQTNSYNLSNKSECAILSSQSDQSIQNNNYLNVNNYELTNDYLFSPENFVSNNNNVDDIFSDYFC